MTTTLPPSSSGKKKVWNIVKWIAGVFLLIGSLGLFRQSFLAGLLILITGLLIIPIISEWLKTQLPFWEKKPIRIIVPIALFVIGAVSMPEETTDSQESSKTIKEQNSKAVKEQNSKVNISPYQSYLDGFKNIKLTEEAKKNREEHLDYYEQNDCYKVLVGSAIVSEKYIPVIQAIAEAVIYSDVEGMAMTENTQKRVLSIGNDALDFVEIAIVVGFPYNGGYTKELIDVFERYRLKYGYYKAETMTYRDKNGEWQKVEPFDFSPIFAVIDPKNPKVLDALYEARKKGISAWYKCDKCFYPYITSKQDYIEYVKQVYPKSPYIPKWQIEISAKDLYRAYKANEVAADNQYKGKILAVTGTVENISKDIFDNPYITLNIGEYFNSVNCNFSKNDNNIIARLNKKQKVTIIGRCDGFFALDVIMKNCEVWEE